MRGEVELNEEKQAESVRISGAGRIAGGEYDSLDVSGSGTIEGDVKANTVSVAGSAKFEGRLEVGKLTVTGTCTIESSLQASSLIVRGNLSVNNNLAAEVFKTYGSVAVDGNLAAEEIYLAGSSKIAGNVECEKFTSRGSFSISKLLTADEIDIWLGTTNRAGEIGGENIKIKKRGPGLNLNREKVKHGVESLEHGLDRIGEKLGFSIELDEEKISTGVSSLEDKMNSYIAQIGKGRLETEIVEGDSLDLEGVKAKIARGTNVIAGRDCSIDKIEYSNTIEINDNCSCGEAVKI